MPTLYTVEPAFANVRGIVATSVAYTLTTVAAGAEATTTVSIPGVAVGDVVIASHTAIGAAETVVFYGFVAASETVTVVITNLHATTALAGGAGNLNVVVFKIG